MNINFISSSLVKGVYLYGNAYKVLL